MSRHVRRAAVALAILALAGAALPGVASAGRVFPPGSHPYGASYGEWSAGWFEWAITLPAAGHPLLQQGRVDCGRGQSGPVWFLGGSFVPGPVSRSCAVPAGTALFVPLINNASLALPAERTPPSELRAHTRAIIDQATGLRASIDGRRVRHLGRFRADSPLFFTRLGSGNVFDLPAQTLLRGVGDGYYLMLRPLPAGSHRLRFRGALAGFALDISYRLTVAGGSATTVHGPFMLF